MFRICTALGSGRWAMVRQRQWNAMQERRARIVALDLSPDTGLALVVVKL